MSRDTKLRLQAQFYTSMRRRKKGLNETDGSYLLFPKHRLWYDPPASAIGISITPRGGSGTPAVITQYFLTTLRSLNIACSLRSVSSLLASSITPVVSLSSLCTRCRVGLSSLGLARLRASMGRRPSMLCVMPGPPVGWKEGMLIKCAMRSMQYNTIQYKSMQYNTIQYRLKRLRPLIEK